MLTGKRVLFATICGFIFGLVCMIFATSNPNATEPVTSTMQWLIIISRTLMGFTIGISAIRLNWWLHGIVLGAITSIPMAIPVLDRIEIAIGTIVMGIIYGFLTELITSIVLKTKSAANL
ncbi:hypothetical protein B6I21_05420 [candidate division KSB1 bacterium 4572_119]|nr:MAG: hypothetical protein B6I21_05420 [candidate division KSB1 bacterium 4572_119]